MLTACDVALYAACGALTLMTSAMAAVAVMLDRALPHTTILYSTLTDCVSSIPAMYTAATAALASVCQSVSGDC